jgi:mono/diheme cytochrome c family protein
VGITAVLLLVALLLVAGCRRQMVDQPKVEPLEASAFFPGNQSARPLTDNAVPRGGFVGDQVFYTGMEDGELTRTFPISLTRQLVERGREQYDIFCSPCHGLAGNGRGMIVERGFPSPPTFHSQRLREAPVGHYFDVISNGFGAMFEYRSRVPPQERWAIIAYIRALQLSQNAPIDSLSAEELQQLEETR